MPYIAPPFTPSVTISGTDLIRNTDEKLQTIANDVGTYLEEETQNAYDDLSLRVTDLETDYNTVLKPEIEAKMDDLLSVNPDGTYYTKIAIDTLVASKVAKVTSTDNAIARFDGTTGAIQNSGVVIDDSNNVGIGITNPNNYKFNNDVELAVGTTTASSAISVVSATTGKGFLVFADGTTGNTRYRGMIEYDHTADCMAFRTAGAEILKLDSSGNVGIGVTPSGWKSDRKSIDIGLGASVVSSGVGVSLFSNSYLNSSSQWLYKQSAAAGFYDISGNVHTWYTATPGTAGNPITWTTALTIPSTGGIQLPNTAIANATTLDWYEEATATLTATGMTTAPTGTGRFTRNGDTVTALMPTISGTSNATTFTLTGIPTSFRPSADRNVLVRVQDNGGAIVVSNATINLSGVLTIYKDAGTTAFTASGTKSVQAIQIQYHI